MSDTETQTREPETPGAEPRSPEPAAEIAVPAAPRTLAGRYVLLERIGAGGLGVVYKAFDADLERRVAIKVLRRRDAPSSEDARQLRLLREGQAIAQLQHPNVVAVHDVGVHDDEFFVAMEYVEGVTLTRWLGGARRPLAAILEIFEQAARGLAAAHERGIVHRDFKPDNVLVGRDGRVRVVDFGLARAVNAMPSEEAEPSAGASPEHPHLRHPLTVTGAVLGTPRYMAPEQHRGEPVDARADVYAFCVALHEAVAGRPPALLDEDEGPPLRIPRERTPPHWLVRLLERGLSREARDRPGSMQEVATALADGRRPRSWTGRVAAIAGAAAVVAVLAWLLAPGTSGPSCAVPADRFAGVWDPAVRADVRAAFSGVDRSYAGERFERVADALDERREAWRAMYVATCEATARGEQSPAMLDLRMECLEERRVALAATIELLRDADAGVLDRALQAVESLPSVAGCADAEALRAAVPLPEDAAARRTVERLQRRLAEARAAHEVGRFADAVAIAEDVLAGLGDVEYAPVRARALAQIARGAGALSDQARAIDVFFEAFDAAGEARDVALQSEIAAQLVYQLGYREDRTAEARAVARIAEGLLASAGAPPRPRAELLRSIGLMHQKAGELEQARKVFEQALEIDFGPGLAAGHYTAYRVSDVAGVERRLGNTERAIELYERALALFEESLGPDHLALTDALRGLALTVAERDPARALALDERALAIEEASRGPDHPSVALSLINFAGTARAMGQVGKAVDAARRAVAIGERAWPEGHAQRAFLGSAYGSLANTLLSAGELADARDAYLRAIDIFTEVHGPDHVEVANNHGNLSIVYQHEGGFEEALRHARLAADIYARVQPDAAIAGTMRCSVAGPLRLLERHREAIVEFEKGLALVAAAVGPEHLHNLGCLRGLALSELALGRASAARAHLEQALAIAERVGGHPAHRAATHFELARALWADGARQEAVTHARAAADGYRKVGAPGEAQLARVEAWLAER